MLIQAGSIFATSALCHFASDWLRQSQKDAVSKSTNWKVRFWHCFDYATDFLLLYLLAFNFNPKAIAISLGILFVSHFIIDTYIPTYWWVKYVRQPIIPTSDFTIEKFKEYAATPIGAIITITVDQIFHLIFVFVASVICACL